MTSVTLIGQAIWKKGELGTYDFYIKESDLTARVLTGHTYKLYAWADGVNIINGATLTNQDATNGILRYTRVSAATDTVREMDAEIVEDEGSATYKTTTFRISVKPTHP